MTLVRLIPSLAAVFGAVVLTIGCGHKGDGHDHHTEEEHDHDHGHHHAEESASGASFKAGTGVTLMDETRQILGVELADLVEIKLPHQIRFTVQVFGEKHHHLLNQEDHSGCDVYGSGLLATNTAAAVKAGHPVQLLKSTNSTLSGIVLAVQKALALGESEIVVGISNATAAVKAGEFVPARINLPRDEPVLAIPQSAVLRTAEGIFVYVLNGNAYLRTPVRIGAESDGMVEVTDGMLPSDRVVTKPVQTLWLIELRITKGGGHSH
jgi:hypothetical protein